MVAGVAIVGCGYVADLYYPSFKNWGEVLKLHGCYDISSFRLSRFCKYYNVPAYASMDELLRDPRISIVINLTNPHEHFKTSLRCLQAGKNVYSEKPLAMDFKEARELTSLAKSLGLHIASAPATVLGPSAQTMWSLVRNRALGLPRLVYAELDDGLVHRIGYENWITRSGTHWPAADEFLTGCTMEHAGYALSWLVAMFGPVRHLVASSACLIKDKGPHTPPNYDTPDFSASCLHFDNGVVARLTNSIIAPHDHRFRVICDEGVLSVDEVWNTRDSIKECRVLDNRFRRGIKKLTGWQQTRKHKPVSKTYFSRAKPGFPIDFVLGPAEMALSISTGRPPRLSGDYALHLTEVSLAIQHPDQYGNAYRVTTSCPPMEPFPNNLLRQPKGAFASRFSPFSQENEGSSELS